MQDVWYIEECTGSLKLRRLSTLMKSSFGMRGKHWIVDHIIAKELKRVFPAYLSGRLIDIGCGDKPLAGLAAPYVSCHVGVDHAATKHLKNNIDIFAHCYDIPVDDASFDCALCTAVLEHLEEPGRAIAECSRILKRGGVLICTAPFIWNLHEEPQDFFRFSKYGLAYLFETNGFRILEIKALSGFWVTASIAFTHYLWKFRRKKGWASVLKPLCMLIPPCTLTIQAAAYLLDRLDTREEWTWMHLVVAQNTGVGTGAV
jgi:SAM-dependent methyltransferase